MRKELLIGVGIGFVVLSLLAGAMFWINKGSYVILEGAIQKIRTQDVEGATVVVVDFRATNPSDYIFSVIQVDLIIDGFEGQVVSDRDAKQFFEYYKQIGPKFNDTLKTKEKVQPHATVDRMVAARFEMPEAKAQARKSLVVRVKEVDGMVVEFKEGGAK